MVPGVQKLYRHQCRQLQHWLSMWRARVSGFYIPQGLGQGDPKPKKKPSPKRRPVRPSAGSVRRRGQLRGGGGAKSQHAHRHDHHHRRFGAASPSLSSCDRAELGWVRVWSKGTVEVGVGACTQRLSCPLYSSCIKNCDLGVFLNSKFTNS